MTLSALARSLPSGGTEQRQIELHWHGGSGPTAGDWVGLFEHDPNNNPTSPLRRITVYSDGPGYFKTDVQFGFPILDRQLPTGDSCLGYWIGYIRLGITIASNCLKIRPSWMWQNRYIAQFSYDNDIRRDMLTSIGTCWDLCLSTNSSYLEHTTLEATVPTKGIRATRFSCAT